MDEPPDEPPDEPLWVSRAAVEAIHVDLLRAHGGSPGVRDENALESALARPRNKLAYEGERDIAVLAAAYGFGLATSHAYTDANKRTAFVVMAVFLGMNGYELDAPEPEVVATMVDVATRRLGETELAAWLRAHTSVRG